MKTNRHVFVLPGNGGGDILGANWYGWVRDTLNKEVGEGVCVARNMPNPSKFCTLVLKLNFLRKNLFVLVVAPMSLWLPFMKNELKIGEQDVIIGHSSGACAAIRFAEKHKVFAIVLVGAYVSDLVKIMSIVEIVLLL